MCHSLCISVLTPLEMWTRRLEAEPLSDWLGLSHSFSAWRVQPLCPLKGCVKDKLETWASPGHCHCSHHVVDPSRIRDVGVMIVVSVMMMCSLEVHFLIKNPLKLSSHSNYKWESLEILLDAFAGILGLASMRTNCGVQILWFPSSVPRTCPGWKNGWSAFEMTNLWDKVMGGALRAVRKGRDPSVAIQGLRLPCQWVTGVTVWASHVPPATSVRIQVGWCVRLLLWLYSVHRSDKLHWLVLFDQIVGECEDRLSPFYFLFNQYINILKDQPKPWKVNKISIFLKIRFFEK